MRRDTITNHTLHTSHYVPFIRSYGCIDCYQPTQRAPSYVHLSSVGYGRAKGRALGRLAWAALLDALMSISSRRVKVRLRVIQPSTFLHHRGVFIVQVAAGFALGRDPTLDEIPNFELGVDVVERPYTDEDGPADDPSPYITKS